MTGRVAGALVAASAVLAAPAIGESVDPVRLAVAAPAVARLDRPVAVRVRVAADPGALDSRVGALRLRVRLAPTCGGDFAGTAGRTAIDRVLSPQPVAGRAYVASASGRARPRTYGRLVVCAFLEAGGDARQYATDTDTTVAVTRACTRAGRALDRARKAVRRARTPRARTRARNGERAALRRARRACR